MMIPALLAVGGGVAVLAWALTRSRPKTDTPAIASRSVWSFAVWVPQTPDDTQRVAAAACQCIDEADPATCVWHALWPGVPSPPIAGDHLSVTSAWSVVQAAVALAHEQGCDARGDAPDRDEADPVSPVNPDRSNEIESLIRGQPQLGFFYDVRADDRLLGTDPEHSIIWRALYLGTIEAALAKGWSESAAVDRARQVANEPANRTRYLHAIQCASRYNAQAYGTRGFGPKAMPSPNGLAIRLLAVHDDARSRLLAGEPLHRTIALGKPSDNYKGTATGAGSSLEMIWLPALRSDALLDPNRSRAVDWSGLYWSDGSSKTEPPPAVVALGIVDVPAGVEWGGC